MSTKLLPYHYAIHIIQYTDDCSLKYHIIHAIVYVNRLNSGPQTVKFIGPTRLF